MVRACGGPVLTGANQVANPELYSKIPCRADSFTVRGDQTLHGALGLRPSNVRCTVLVPRSTARVMAASRG